MNMDRQTTSYRIATVLHKRLEQGAIHLGVSRSALVNLAVAQFLAQLGPLLVGRRRRSALVADIERTVQHVLAQLREAA